MSFSRAPFTGFPFDGNDDADVPLRERLDDITRRYPEFADLDRHRHQRQHRPDDERPFGFFRRPGHASRFEHLGFPFDDDVDEELLRRTHFPDDRAFYSHHPEYYEQEPQHPAEGATVDTAEKKEQNPKFTEAAVQTDGDQLPATSNNNDTSTGGGTSLKQSNTVDLGQPQEPEVVDDRGQRSMSAPPDHRANPAGRRFVSSINIPNLNSPYHQQPQSGQPHPTQQHHTSTSTNGINPLSAGGDMGGKMSSQQHQHAQTSDHKPNERIIPIHIEGRDEPVIPKNVSQSHASAPPHSHPEPSSFGQRAGMFTSFAPKDETDAAPKNQQQQQQPQEEAAVKKQQQEYATQQNQRFQDEKQQQEQQQQQQPPPAAPKPTPLELIQVIQKDVSSLMLQVENFVGKVKDKQYIYLDEMLTRNLLKLDLIETEGKDAVRQARREAVKCIQACIKVLEAKATEADKKKKQQEVKMEVTEGGDAPPNLNQTTEAPPVAAATIESAPTQEAEEVKQPVETAKSEIQSENENKVVEKEVEEKKVLESETTGTPSAESDKAKKKS